jgi:hypothetical protein
MYACDQIQTRFPTDLRAQTQERLVIALPGDVAHAFVPDVRVVERPRPVSGGVALAEEEAQAARPFVLELVLPRAEAFIEIVEAGARERVVTVIEVLSRSNKEPGKDQESCLRKRDDLEEAGISLVEIDLLRAGRRVAMVHPTRVPASHQTPYQAAVRRGWGRPLLELYAMPLRERLPNIAVPLRSTDRDVVLELQPLIEQVYRNGRYDDIDYRAPAQPPLEGEDAAWANALLRERGLR